MPIPSRVSDFSKMAALIAVYVLVAQGVTLLLGSNSVIGFLLFTSGLALSVLVLGGLRFVPALLIGALLGFASLGESPALALTSALRHVGTAYLCVWLLQRISPLDPDMPSLRDTLRLFALAIAFGFVVALSMGLLESLSPALVTGTDSFVQRWSGHTLSVIVVMPLLLVWRTFPREWATPLRALEALLILGITFVVGQVVFLDWMHDALGQIARGYWLYLFITWSAVRLGAPGAVLVLAMVAVQGLTGATFGRGFFANDLEKTHLSNYFFYTMALAAVSLLLATYFTERKRVFKALEHHRNTLESTVASRTAELATRLDEMSALNKKLEDAQIQLLQSEKMASLGQLAAGVAHEINNPVGFVHSNLGTLENHVASIFETLAAYEAAIHATGNPQAIAAMHQWAAQKEISYLQTDIPALLQESKEGMVRIKDIVQNLKDFSRLGDSQWEWADMHQCLDSTLKILTNELKYKCTVVKHYDPHLPKVRCVAGQINQVFMNLLVNAAHAIATRGEVTIVTQSPTSGTVQISITDTGSGISAENLGRIFDPFFTTKPIGQGTGLGLSIVYSIVRKHFGKIDVQSTLGQGSTFVLTLPIDPPV